jgi:hypothetical protein
MTKLVKEHETAARLRASVQALLTQTTQLRDEQETARRLGLSVQTLRNHRCQGVGLPYVKVGRSVRYSDQDVERFIAAHRIETRDSGEPGNGVGR